MNKIWKRKSFFSYRDSGFAERVEDFAIEQFVAQAKGWSPAKRIARWLSEMGQSRHSRRGRKLSFVRFTPLATVLGMGPKGRDVPIGDNAALQAPQTERPPRGGLSEI